VANANGTLSCLLCSTGVSGCYRCTSDTNCLACMSNMELVDPITCSCPNATVLINLGFTMICVEETSVLTPTTESCPSGMLQNYTTCTCPSELNLTFINGTCSWWYKFNFGMIKNTYHYPQNPKYFAEKYLSFNEDRWRINYNLIKVIIMCHYLYWFRLHYSIRLWSSFSSSKRELNLALHEFAKFSCSFLMLFRIVFLFLKTLASVR
jgi:hypothetical protein